MDATKSISRENFEKKLEPPGKKRMRHRVLKRYCRNVRQDQSLMNLVFYYENAGLCQPDNLDHQIGNGNNQTGNDSNISSSKKNRNRKKFNKANKNGNGSTKKASDDNTKISSNEKSASATSASSSSKAKQPWWKAKSDKKETGKTKRR